MFEEKYIIVFFILSIHLAAGRSLSLYDIAGVHEGEMSEQVDSTLVISLIESGERYRQTNQDSSIYYFEKAIKMANQIKSDYLMAKAYTGLSVCLSLQSKYDEGMGAARKSVLLFKKLGRRKDGLYPLKTIGLNYWQLTKYDSALIVFHSMLPIVDSLGYESFKVPLYNNIGMVYEETGQVDKALEYYYKGLALARKYDDKKGKSLLSNNLSIILRHQKKFKESNNLVRESIKIAQEIGFNEQWARGYSNLGANYTAMGDYSAAVKALDEALRLQRKFDFNTIKTLWHLGEVYDKMGDYDTAVRYIQSSLEEARKGHQREDILWAHRKFFDIYKHWGKPQMAYRSKDSIIFWKDSLANLNFIQAMADAERKYQNEALKAKLEMSNVSLEMAKNKRKQNLMWFLISIMAMMGLASIGYYYLKKRQFKELIKKEEEVSETMISQIESYRRLIASNLHDDLGQNLAMLKNLIEKDGSDEEKVYLDRTIKKMRRLSRELYPSILEVYGLTKAVDDMVKNLNRDGRIFFSFDLANLESLLDKDRQIHVFRIIQEGFNNVLKHSGATAARVSFDGVTNQLIIEDNGSGFPKTIIQKIGLVSIKVKVRLLKAKLTIENTYNGGAKIIIQF